MEKWRGSVQKNVHTSCNEQPVIVTAHISKSFAKKQRSVFGIILSKNTEDPLTVRRLYTALVRPYLEHAAQVWNFYLAGSGHLVGRNTKARATVCMNLYPKTGHCSEKCLQSRLVVLVAA